MGHLTTREYCDHGLCNTGQSAAIIGQCSGPEVAFMGKIVFKNTKCHPIF